MSASTFTSSDKDKFKQQFRQRLIRLSIKALKFAQKLRKDRNLWTIADQFIDSLTSIGANVFEAQGALSKRGYASFFEISLKSSNETKYWLIVIREYSDDPAIKKEAQEILDEVIEISKVVGASIMTLRGRR